MKVMIVDGISRSLVNFRGPLIRAMRAMGHEIVTCSGEPRDDMVARLRDWGIGFTPVRLFRAGMHPWKDLRTCCELFFLMREHRPDIVLAYTIKPVIWGGLAARMAGIRDVHALITGLGYAFLSGRSLKRQTVRMLATFLYWVSLSKCRRVFFQNPDDMQDFSGRGLIKNDQSLLVNGSGVDLDHYALAPLPETPNFLMICRLLADKGVHEFVRAARIIKERHPAARFRLAGPLDPNPAGVSRAELEQWKNEGVIEYLGVLEDVRPAFRDCSIFVLPSYYREGTPRVILEAMSMGRPIITTNAPGCRETIRLPDGCLLDKESKNIIRGENGFLIPAKDTEKLIQAMQTFIDSPDLIIEMGQRSSKIAEEKYDVHKVNEVILQNMGLI